MIGWPQTYEPTYHGNTKQFGMYAKKKNQRQKRKAWRQNPTLRKKA